MNEKTTLSKRMGLHREIAIFISMLALCSVIFWGIRDLSVGKVHNPGPGFMPFWSGVLLLILASVDFLRNWRKTLEGQPEIRPSIKSLLALVGIVGFILITPYLGFLITVFFLLILFFSLIEFGNPLKTIALSGISTAVVYIVFVLFMQCQFPRGILWMG